MIAVEKICKSYSSKIVLDSIDFAFEKTGFYSIHGASGSGKTTFVSILAGHHSPDGGNVFLNNVPVTADELVDNVSYLFQSHNLIEGLTAYQNLMHLGSRNEIENAFKNMGIDHDLLHQDVRNLSGGQRQRIAAIKITLEDKPIIILDEPTSSADRANALSILNYFKSLSNEKLIIVVSHDETITNKLADTILYFVNGKIEMNKPPEQNREIVIEKTGGVSISQSRSIFYTRLKKAG